MIIHQIRAYARILAISVRRDRVFRCFLVPAKRIVYVRKVRNYYKNTSKISLQNISCYDEQLRTKLFRTTNNDGVIEHFKNVL